MTTVALRTVAVAALLILAGCSGTFGADRPDREPYGVDEPVDPSADESGEMTRGLTSDGLDDANALRRAHRDAIDDRPYRIRTEIVYAYENGSTAYAAEQRERLDYENGTFSVRLDERGTYPGIREQSTDDVDGNRTAELWIDPTRRLHRTEFENGTVTYDREIRSRVRPGETRLFRALQSMEEPRVEPATIERDRYYVVEGESGDRHWPGTTSRNLSATVYVQENGLVRHYRLDGTVEVDGEELRVREEVTLYAVGETTVDRPAWYDEAVEATEDDSDD